VVLAESDDAMIGEAESLLADPAAREALGRRANGLYETSFAIHRTLEQLQNAAMETAAASASPP
jgi:hypothetical protein